MPFPKVSVVVCVFNGETLIGRALDSVFAQNFDGIEVVVVDDGSTDGTPQALLAYRDRIRTIRQDNRGLAASRNAGVAAGRGEYVAFLDADDVWLPQRLAKTLAPLEREPSAVMAYSDAVPVDDSDRPLGDSFVQRDRAHAPSMDEILASWWPILPSAVLMRRKTMEACGGFNETYRSASGYEDTFLFMRAREQGPFEYVAEPLIRYRLAPFVERMAKYGPGFRVFARHVRERYGAAGDSRIRNDVELFSRYLINRGMQALAQGDTRLARRVFWCLRHYKPLQRRDVGRLLRSYLPPPLAIALTSRRRRDMAENSHRQASGAGPPGNVLDTW